MSKVLIFLSLALLILALESNGAKFAPFGIHLTHKRRFVHPSMRIQILKKLTKNHPKVTYEEELQKLLTNQPKVEKLQDISLSEAKKMIDYMTIRKI